MARQLCRADIVPCVLHTVQARAHARRIVTNLSKNVCKGISIARKRFRAFHNSFFVGKETVRDPSISMDAHMRIRLDVASTATAFAVALATISLAACGPDAGPATANSGPGPATAAAAPAPQTGPTSGGSASASGTPTASSTSDPVQNAEASLAADGQQVTPVLSYAPGEEAGDTGNPGDDSRRGATSSQQ